MYCPNCGAQIPDDGRFCSYCGQDTAAQESSGPDFKYGSLTVVRVGSTVAQNIATRVIVNGEPVMSLGNGSSETISLNPGRYTVVFRTEGLGNFAKTLEIAAGTETAITFQLIAAQGNNYKILGISNHAHDGSSSQMVRSAPEVREVVREVPVAQQPSYPIQRCPKCGGIMTTQVITESRHAGCFTILLYIILALTILGLFIVIPLMLRKKTETVTYSVCQNCGYSRQISRR